MKYSLYIISIFILITVTACTKKCPCYPARIYLNYIGFLNSETDTVIIRRFQKGSSFLLIKDTGILSINNSGYYPHNDTMHIRTDVESLILRSGFDYELFLPATNKLSRISDINEELKEDYCISRNLNGCINPISSFKLDGQPALMNPAYPNVYKTINY